MNNSFKMSFNIDINSYSSKEENGSYILEIQELDPAGRFWTVTGESIMTEEEYTYFKNNIGSHPTINVNPLQENT